MSEDIFERNGELEGVLQQVSSQLRASLGNIHHALERLAPPEARDADKGIDKNAAILCQSYYRILRLADNLADAASLDGSNAPQLTNDDIVIFCRDLIDKAEYLAELLGLRLVFQCEKSSHSIAMNAQRLERLLMNLLSNAFKFTPRGGTVTLEVRVERRNVILLVTDTGCGIPPELLETVFDRYRATDRMDPPPHGLGLGLPICRRIAQEHGGSLLLTSKVDEGTTVTVSLPNRKEGGLPPLREPGIVSGGHNRTLVELADALPKEAFVQKLLN